MINIRPSLEADFDGTECGGVCVYVCVSAYM